MSDAFFPHRARGIVFVSIVASKEVLMKRTVNNIDKDDNNAPVYTWSKFITQVFWIFIMLFAMVKIVQAFAS